MGANWTRLLFFVLIVCAASPSIFARTTLGNGPQNNAYSVKSGDNGPIITFTNTDLVFADQADIPETGWQRRNMPPIWLSDEARLKQHGNLVAWARFRFDKSRLADGPLALYTENNRERITIFVNGYDIFRNYRDERSATLGWNHPYMVPLPKRLLRDGDNEIILRVASHQQFSLGVGSMTIGPQGDIAAKYTSQYFWRISGPQAANYAMLFLTIIVFVMWLGRIKEMELLWLTLTGAFWFVRDYHFFAGEAIGDPFIFQQITYYSLYFAVVSSLSFCAAFLKMRHSNRIITFMFGAGVALCVFRFLVMQSTRTDLLSSLMTLILSFGFIIAMYLSWRRKPSNEHLAMLLVVLATSLLGLHDIGRIPNIQWWDGLGFHIQPFTGLLLFTVFLFSLGRRFLAALGEVERMNLHLETRVHDATSALAQSEAARQKLEVERALESERERLMREMHDGIGSNLVTALAIARQNRHDKGTVTTLERAITDLKITVDSLAPVNGDVVTLLANLRHRLEPDLNLSGVHCIWKAQPCPNLDWLDATNALHMLRIVQEAVSNVLMHSGATQITIGCEPEIKERASGISISVGDNGRGFRNEIGESLGQGLSNMQSRAQALQGTLQVSSLLGDGTIVTLWLPQIKSDY